ncbi:MAG: hypothetical protein JKX97_01870 [Candidatus Lindowbacteria bacterium]|nr:hypothetical protein [Candidatus Lindowbacteria bacterium]
MAQKSLLFQSLLLLVLLALLLPISLETTDEELYFGMARGIVTFGIPIFQRGDVTRIAPTPPIFPALVSAHLIYVNKIYNRCKTLFPYEVSVALYWGMVSSINVLLSVLVFFISAKYMKIGSELCLMLFVSSMLLFFGTTLFIETFFAALLLIAMIAFEKNCHYLFAAALSLLCMAKTTYLFIVLPLPVFLYLNCKDVRKTIICSALFLVLPTLFQFAYNDFMRGSFLNFGYDHYYYIEAFDVSVVQGFNLPLWYGLTGFLLSPGKSFLLYNISLVPGLIGLFIGIRREKSAFAVTVLTLILAHLFLYSGWSQWEGGFSYGPRFLVPIIPLCLFGFRFIDLKKLRFWIGLSIVVGFGINLTARSIDLYELYVNTGQYGSGVFFPLAYNFFGEMFPEYITLLTSSDPRSRAIFPLLLGGTHKAILIWQGLVIFLFLFMLNRWMKIASVSKTTTSDDHSTD